jgi:hypothetical protein
MHYTLKTCQRQTCFPGVLLITSIVGTFASGGTRADMKLSPDAIQASIKFRQILILEYSAIPEFVLKQLRTVNPVTFAFYSATLLIFALALMLRFNLPGEYSLLKVLPYTGAGLILFPLLLIPVHEALHVALLWLLGGKNITIGSDIKNFIFYVTAHRHVLPAFSFLAIALFPFVVITAAILTAILFLDPIWKWSLWLTLLIHTTMCAGDVAMAVYYYINRDKKLITWDDTEKGIALFYQVLDETNSAS